MTKSILISSLWKQISEMDEDFLNSNASVFGNLYDCEIVLGLSPLPEMKSSENPDRSVLAKKPSFKNLDIKGIQSLRLLVESDRDSKEIREWAETLMRFLEIHQTTLKRRSKEKYGSFISGRYAMLELTAFLMDCHFAWDDLRFLNTALKIMSFRWIFSLDGKATLKLDNSESTNIFLLQFRLMVMREAALLKASETIKNA